MCNIDDPPASAIVADTMDYKQRSLSNPDGVQYMDHLWAMIEDIDQPLTVVLRTDQDIFEDVPIKAYWSFDDKSRHYRSQLAFDLPDEVCRRIQSQHAREVRTRYFGDNSPVDLPEVFRPTEQRDGTRKSRTYYGPTTTVLDDWQTLKEAIRLTAKDSGGYLGGQSVMLNGEMEAIALARVNNSRLELLIDSELIFRINRHWNRDLGNLLGVKGTTW